MSVCLSVSKSKKAHFFLRLRRSANSTPLKSRRRRLKKNAHTHSLISTTTSTAFVRIWNSNSGLDSEKNAVIMTATTFSSFFSLSLHSYSSVILASFFCFYLYFSYRILSSLIALKIYFFLLIHDDDDDDDKYRPEMNSSSSRSSFFFSFLPRSIIPHTEIELNYVRHFSFPGRRSGQTHANIYNLRVAEWYKNCDWSQQNVGICECCIKTWTGRNWPGGDIRIRGTRTTNNAFSGAAVSINSTAVGRGQKIWMNESE